MTASPDPRLGIQLWLERDDPRERIERLIGTAADLGFGRLRIFVMWPWIQPDGPDAWQWRMYDDVLDVAAAHGIGIKATLTANSGPWWLGTPGVLHSHTMTLHRDWVPAVEEYVHRTVERYAGHPGLAQWVLWNEPDYQMHSGSAPIDRGGIPPVRPEGSRELWAQLLRERYHGDIAALNARWRGGWADFDEVPFPEDVVHPAHKGNVWASFAPLLDDYRLRATIVEAELDRIAALVRDRDAATPLCVNPNQTLLNQAEHGYRMPRLARSVDVLGASFHAPWSFAYAPARDHTALVVAGLTLLQTTPGGHRTEVTELQAGNTFYAGYNPLGVGQAEAAANWLAPLLAGAESVTGWCFNTRAQDFEAGEWGLLSDDDTPGDRARAITAVRDALGRLDAAVGPWRAARPRAFVLTSEDSQAVQLAFAGSAHSTRNTSPLTASQGASLLAVGLGRLGVPTALAPVAALSDERSADLVVAAHLAAWDDELADRLLAVADAGATVLIDGTSGEFDLDARLHRPWPGGIAARTGMRSRGLDTDPAGGVRTDLLLHGEPLGTVVGARNDVAIEDAAWRPDGALTYARDGRPVLWERAWGAGRILYCTAPLAASLPNTQEPATAAAYLLARAAERIERDIRPLSAATSVYRVDGERGSAWGVVAPSIARRGGRPVTLAVPAGVWRELWTGRAHTVDAGGVLVLDAVDGIALLVRV